MNVPLEYRAKSLDRVSTDAGLFSGHAAVFGERTAIGQPGALGFYEEIATSAFDRALAEDQDVRLLVDHDPSKLLARTAAGTLNLGKDKTGLRVEADLPETSVGNDVRILLRRGDLSAMSFGFIAKKDSWQELEDGSQLRTVEDVDLFDVSIVTFPAYPQTDAQVRAVLSRAPDMAAIRRHVEAMQRFAAIKAPEGVE